MARPAQAPWTRVVEPAEVLAPMDLAAAAPHALRTDDLHPWSIRREDPWALGMPDLEPASDGPSAPTLADFQWPRTGRPIATGRKAHRATFVAACAIGAVAVITALAVFAFASTRGTDQNRSSTSGRVKTAPAVVPSTLATLPGSNQPTAAWWAATGQPETHALLADIQTMNGQLGDPTALGASCHAFSADIATASAAAPPPTPSINREWQQTLSTVTRVADACAAGNYARLGEDLEPASLTINDLGAQVANDLR